MLGRFVAFRHPIAAIPELYRTAAILTFWNSAFEIAVIEWMVLDFDREPLVVGIERRAARDSPGLEHAVEFEPQIVMEAGGCVFLDHETRISRRGYRNLAARLGGLGEIPLSPIS